VSFVTARKITLRYKGRCRKCRQTIPTGTKAYWEPKRGVWHLECNPDNDEARTRPDKDGAFILDRSLGFKRMNRIQPPTRFKISRSTQLGLVFALVIVLAFGGALVSSNLAPRTTGPTEIETYYRTDTSYVTPTLRTTETIYVTETPRLTLTYTRTTEAGTKTTPSSKGMFVGSRLSDIYHWPSCYWAKQIRPYNEIWFKDSADARAHGYRPCKVCKPP